MTRFIATLLGPVCKKFRKLMISMIAVAALGFGMMIALPCMHLSLQTSLSSYIEDYCYADVTITIEPAQKEIASALKDIKGVDQVNTRVLAQTTATGPTNRTLYVQAYSYGEDDFQQFYVWETAKSSEYPNVYVENKFAENNGISAGDILTVDVFGEPTKVCVGSLVSSPECLGVFATSIGWGANSDFGKIFFPKSQMEGTQYELLCNQILLRTMRDADSQSVLDAACDKLEALGVTILSKTTYEDSPVHGRLETNAGPIESLSKCIPPIFAVITFIVLFLFLTVMIQQYRKQTGILFALGVERSKVRGLYCALSLVVACGAIVLGIPCACLVCFIVGTYYLNFFPLPNFVYCVEWCAVIISAVLIVVICLAAALLSSLSLRHVLPSEALSRAPIQSARASSFVDRLTKKASPLLKFNIAVLFKNKKRFAFTVVCIACTVALVLCAFAFSSSKNAMFDQLYQKRVVYGCQIFLNSAPTDELIADLKQSGSATEIEEVEYFSTTIEANGKSEDVTLCAINAGASLMGVVDNTGKQTISVPQEGLVLESHQAQSLGVDVGDEVVVDGVALKVAALSNQNLNRYSYVSHEQAKKINLPGTHALLVNFSDEQSLVDCAMGHSDCSYCVLTSYAKEEAERLFASYDLATGIVLVFALAIGLVIVYNTTQTSLLERKKELCMLRSLGFRTSKISAHWFVQTAIQFVMSCIVGLPIGAALAQFVLSELTTSQREYPMTDSIWQYVITIVVVFAYVGISHLLAMRSMRKWSIAEEVKEKE